MGLYVPFDFSIMGKAKLHYAFEGDIIYAFLEFPKFLLCYAEFQLSVNSCRGRDATLLNPMKNNWFYCLRV